MQFKLKFPILRWWGWWTEPWWRWRSSSAVKGSPLITASRRWSLCSPLVKIVTAMMITEPFGARASAAAHITVPCRRWYWRARVVAGPAPGWHCSGHMWRHGLSPLGHFSQPACHLFNKAQWKINIILSLLLLLSSKFFTLPLKAFSFQLSLFSL